MIRKPYIFFQKKLIDFTFLFIDNTMLYLQIMHIIFPVSTRRSILQPKKMTSQGTDIKMHQEQNISCKCIKYLQNNSIILIYLSFSEKFFRGYCKTQVIFLDRNVCISFFNASYSNYHLANESFKFHLHNWCQF